MAYLGNSPGVSSQRVATTFTATAGQTAFNPVGGYTLGYADVFLNGVKLIDGTDFTAADGVTITLVAGAALNDNLETLCYTPHGLSDGYTKPEADARYQATSNGSIDVTGTVTAAAGIFTTADINAGTIDGTVIGGVTPAAGSFTTLGTTGAATFSGNLLVGTNTAYTGGKLSVNGGIVQPGGNQNVIGVYGTSGLQMIGVTGGDNVIGTMGANEPLVLRTGSTEAMRIDSTGAATFSGRVSVSGATNPNSSLAIVSDSGANAVEIRTRATYNDYAFINFNSTDGSEALGALGVHRTAAATASLIFYSNDGTAGVNEAGRFDASGNLGVGTSSPADYGATANTLEVKGASGSGIGALQLQGADSVVKALLYAGGSTEFVINTQSNHNMGFNTNNTRAMTIDASGNLGIGVISPSSYYPPNLVVGAAAEGGITIASTATTNTNYLNFADSTSGVGRYAGMIAYNHATDSMAFRTVSVQRMVLDASGSLYVGGTDLAYEGTKLITGSYSATSAGLSILSSSSGVGYLLFGDGTGTNGYSGQINYNHNQNRMGFNTNNVEYMAINSAGDLLLNTAVPLVSGKQSILFNGSTHNGLVLKTTRVALNSTFAAFINVSGSICGSIIQNGTTTVHYSASSDRRLKENISDSDDSGSVIDAIQVRKFDWIGTDEHERFGFIAQELQEVVPIAVCSMGMAGEEDPMLGVDPSKLMALAIKEIQSLRARIAILEGA